MNCAVKLVVGKDNPCIGPGLVALLEEIADSSSVMQACTKMEISYSKAWKLIRQAEDGLGCQLVNRKSGGNNKIRLVSVAGLMASPERFM